MRALDKLTRYLLTIYCLPSVYYETSSGQASTNNYGQREDCASSRKNDCRYSCKTWAVPDLSKTHEILVHQLHLFRSAYRRCWLRPSCPNCCRAFRQSIFCCLAQLNRYYFDRGSKSQRQRSSRLLGPKMDIGHIHNIWLCRFHRHF